MANWSAFHPYLMIHVPGCPSPLANQELRTAAEEFFAETRAWQEWLDPFTAIEGKREYDIDPPPNTRVVRIEGATRDGAKIDIDGFQALPSDPALHDQDGRGLSSADRITIVLARAPSAGARYQLKVSLAPIEGSSGIPDSLYVPYRRHILDGAKAALRLIPGTTFYNEKLAAVDLTNFQVAMGRENALAWKSNTGTTPRPKTRWV